MASGSQVGSAIVKLEFDGSNVKASLNSVGKEMESAGKSGGSKFGGMWAVAAGNLISKGISKIAGVITSNLGGAISRVDTLNNFPNVMSNLGISAEASSTAIEKISDKLSGLPTALDAGASAVQRFTSKNNDVEKSTDIFLSLNNALLAGGASADIQSTALEQISQAYAKGKPDMMEWRSLMTAMPAQLNQVAQSMGYGANGADALGEALRNGDVSMDEFMAQIGKLNTEGANGFASFEEQARNATGGIQTQMTNLSTSIKKMLADGLNGKDMSKSMDQFVERLESIIEQLGPGLLNIISGVITFVGTKLPQMLVKLMPKIGEGISKIVTQIAQTAPQFVQSLLDIVIALVNAITTNLPTILNAVVQAIIQIAQTIVQPQNLTAILNAWIQLMLTLVQAIPEIIIALVDALPDIIDSVIQWLTDPNTIGMLIDASIQLWSALITAVPRILGALLGAFGKLVGSLWNGITKMFGEFAGKFGNFIAGIFKGAINGVLQFIENFINGPIDIINGFIGAINDTFGGLGIHIDTIGRINLPRLAQGGYANGATGAIIGEAGKEVVLPLEQNTDNWAGLLASTLADQFEKDESVGGRDIIMNNTFEINNEMDADDIGRKLMQSIRRSA